MLLVGRARLEWAQKDETEGISSNRFGFVRLDLGCSTFNWGIIAVREIHK